MYQKQQKHLNDWANLTEKAIQEMYEIVSLTFSESGNIKLLQTHHFYYVFLLKIKLFTYSFLLIKLNLFKPLKKKEQIQNLKKIKNKNCIHKL